MPVFRVWRKARSDCYFTEADSAEEAVDLIQMIVSDHEGWQAAPDSVDFEVTTGVIFDKSGKPIKV